MKENLLCYGITIAVIVAMSACFTIFSDENNYIVEFLNSYGYEVSAKPTEAVKVKIPEPLDMVYEEYNELQKRAGFNLEPYQGKNGTRYTYEVKNHYSGEDGVRANVLVIDGKIVGGDICTLKIDGFMHEICKNKLA